MGEKRKWEWENLKPSLSHCHKCVSSNLLTHRIHIECSIGIRAFFFSFHFLLSPSFLFPFLFFISHSPSFLFHLLFGSYLWWNDFVQEFLLLLGSLWKEIDLEERSRKEMRRKKMVVHEVGTQGILLFLISSKVESETSPFYSEKVSEKLTNMICKRVIRWSIGIRLTIIIAESPFSCYEMTVRRLGKVLEYGIKIERDKDRERERRVKIREK